MSSVLSETSYQRIPVSRSVGPLKTVYVCGSIGLVGGGDGSTWTTQEEVVLQLHEFGHGSKVHIILVKFSFFFQPKFPC